MRVAREGWPFILSCWVPTVFFLVSGWVVIGILFFGAGLAFSFFFRDPKRRIPTEENLLVSPADGRVIRINPGVSHPLLSGPLTSVSIFLSLFDVHIIRSPLSAEVLKTEHTMGRFFPAYRDEAGSANESRSLLLRGEKTDVLLKQIVGVAARRIKCYVREKENVAKGQKIGLIYFGSRVEIYLPPCVRVTASSGQRVKAGETILGKVIE